MRNRPILTLLVPALAACAGHHAPASPPPRLAVVLVVDQMTPDYLSRFDGLYTRGLRRLLDEGAVFDEAHHEHALTLTGSGHATLSTGSWPRHSGIVGNGWWDRTARREVYCAEGDATVFGGPPDGPGRSPAQLLRPGLSDWLEQGHPDGEVHAVAIKDRGAILVGGKHPDGVYWYDAAGGRFTSSTHYFDSLPGWVEAWNAEGHPEEISDGTWNRLLPEEAYAVSREDDFSAEADGERTTFPHRFDPELDGTDGFFAWLRGTPAGDELTFEFARRLIVERDLGRDEIPDLLWLGASAADYVGHTFGPYSQEVQDYYLRLDRWLGDLLDRLDSRVGPGRYVVALTSDHGVMPLPEELQRRGIDAGRDDPQLVAVAVRDAVERSAREMGIDYPVGVRFSGGIVLVPPRGLDEARAAGLRRGVARRLAELPFLADAYSRDELLDPETPDRELLEAYRRCVHPERGPDVFLRFPEQTLPGGGSHGTSHGSPYRHDTHVPLVFWGAGIPAGRHPQPVGTVDLAPTLARLLGVEPPGDLDGEVLNAVVP